MVGRVALKKPAVIRPKKLSAGGNYFSAPKSNLRFIKTGCKVLDLALGGGWVEGRVVNIIGDKSTGKSLQAIEASANFAAKYKQGKVRYREIESAFDKGYAGALGMPIDRVDFGKKQLETVEDFFNDLDEVLNKAKGPELYIIDSLDALSDDAEMARGMEDASYGTAKAKKMSELFRRVVRRLEDKRMTLMVISQIRSKIGVTFGKTTTRTGGRALDFYATHVVELAHLGVIGKVLRGQSRPTGIKVKAKIAKNKVSLPYREAEYDLLFGFGVDDAGACLNWLKSANLLGDVDLKPKQIKGFLDDMMKGSDEDFKAELANLHEVVTKRWYEIEAELMPTRKKYG